MQSRKRILIVDDSPIILSELKNDLEDEYDIVTATSGEEAVKSFEDPKRERGYFNSNFDLIITDVVMPGMNGYELAHYVRSRNRLNKFTPVIALATAKINMEEARKSGCVAFFSKADTPKLLSMVRILLAAKASKRSQNPS